MISKDAPDWHMVEENTSGWGGFRTKRAQSPRARNRQAALSARAEDTVAGVRRLDDGRGFVNVRMTENRKRAGSCSVHGAYDASGNADADGRDRSAEEMRPGCTVHASTGRVRRVQVVVKGAKGTGTVNVASFRRRFLRTGLNGRKREIVRGSEHWRGEGHAADTRAESRVMGGRF